MTNQYANTQIGPDGRRYPIGHPMLSGKVEAMETVGGNPLIQRVRRHRELDRPDAELQAMLKDAGLPDGQIHLLLNYSDSELYATVDGELKVRPGKAKEPVIGGGRMVGKEYSTPLPSLNFPVAPLPADDHLDQIQKEADAALEALGEVQVTTNDLDLADAWEETATEKIATSLVVPDPQLGKVETPFADADRAAKTLASKIQKTGGVTIHSGASISVPGAAEELALKLSSYGGTPGAWDTGSDSYEDELDDVPNA